MPGRMNNIPEDEGAGPSRERAIDEDVEGHGRFTEEPESDDVEAHGPFRAVPGEDDVEAHGPFRAVPGEDDDVEGHGFGGNDMRFSGPSSRGE